MAGIERGVVVRAFRRAFMGFMMDSRGGIVGLLGALRSRYIVKVLGLCVDWGL